MKKIAILQSSYIPWKGYFDIIASDGKYSDTQSVTLNVNNKPETLTVSDTGWDLYKDVLSDQFAPSEWSDILGSSLSGNIKRLIDGQNLEVSDRWASAEINPLDYLSSQLSVFNDTQSLQDDLSSRFNSIIESNTDLDIVGNGFVLTDSVNNVSLVVILSSLFLYVLSTLPITHLPELAKSCSLSLPPLYMSSCTTSPISSE